MIPQRSWPPFGEPSELPNLTRVSVPDRRIPVCRLCALRYRGNCGCVCFSSQFAGPGGYTLASPSDVHQEA